MSQAASEEKIQSDTVERPLVENSEEGNGRTNYSQALDLSPEQSPTPYTAFTTFQQRLLVSVLMPTMLASPLTATIYQLSYHPLLSNLASQYKSSI